MAGGRRQESDERGKLRVLAGRTVLLFPDADAYAEWKQRAECISFCKVIVSDLIEKNATPEQKAAHIDIADWIVFRYGKVNNVYSQPSCRGGKNPRADD